MKPVPLTVNTWLAVPATTEAGDKPETSGTWLLLPALAVPTYPRLPQPKLRPRTASMAPQAAKLAIRGEKTPASGLAVGKLGTP
jgi:hypothetical protein